MGGTPELQARHQQLGYFRADGSVELLETEAAPAAGARGLRIKRVALAGVSTAPRAVLLRAVTPLLPRGRLEASERRGVARRVQQRLQATLGAQRLQ